MSRDPIVTTWNIDDPDELMLRYERGVWRVEVNGVDVSNRIVHLTLDAGPFRAIVRLDALENDLERLGKPA